MQGQTRFPLILGLDIAGVPIDWLTCEEAVCLEVRGQIAWSVGQGTAVFRGGTNRLSGERSTVEISTIVAIRNARSYMQEHVIPALTNAHLFRRDRNTCMYCGGTFAPSELTRDHVVPRSRGGRDAWGNVSTACRPCNARKGGRTPEEADMPLLALPYTPSRIEALILRNRRILADQMEFLRRHLPRRAGSIC